MITRLLEVYAPQTHVLAGLYLQGLTPTDSSVGGNDDYVLSAGDERRRVLASIRIRRGQQKFRKSLITRYGAQCMISGCNVMDIGEAAHIWPYRSDADNDPANGCLLRADLHTLYDLDLIGIDEDLTLHLSERLKGSDYERFAGMILNAVIRPSAAAIALRWKAFTGG